LTKNPTPISWGPIREWDRSGHRFGSTEKAQEALAFKANTSLQDGLEKTVAWTQNNIEEIDACIAKHKEFMQ
jgi:UDP-glucose 4-epimerase